MRFRLCAPLVFVAISFATVTAIAKIPPQKPVPPVESNGVRYAAEDAEYVSATEIATGKQLWRVRVFHTHIHPWLEPDVQFVFITELKFVDGSLFVRDGKARCYAVDVRNHRVRRVPGAPGPAFGTRETMNLDQVFGTSNSPGGRTNRQLITAFTKPPTQPTHSSTHPPP
jgi:hypothetical protein